MTRAVFEKGQLSQFLNKRTRETKMSLPQLAKLISVERHTLNDWRREKLLPNLEKLKILSESARAPLPPILETRRDTWGSSKAGHVRQQKYGCTLSIKDRVKGGHGSQVARKSNPEYYRDIGCIVANSFLRPNYSSELAEIVGAILGDGCITNNQLHITLNSKLDIGYAYYLQGQIQKLFGYSPSILKRKECNAVNVVVTGVNYISYLKSIGLQIGDKVRQQVDVPDWIKNDQAFSRSCVRGLMDTDGGVFRNTYSINNHSYSYLKVCFVNLSQPLRKFTHKVLSDANLSPSSVGNSQVWVASEKNAYKYMQIIGSSNDRLHRKFR